MASVVFGKDFLKSAKKLPGAQQRKLADLLLTLSQNCYYPTLHTKPLSDVLTGFYSFRITRDWRVVFLFKIPNMLRTNTCGELTAKNKGKKVTLCGWVHRRRNHGGLLFIDLRDRYGLTQVTFDPNKNKSAYEAADAWRSEWVVSVSGEVALRPKEMMNEKMPTGEIEIVATQAKTLSESKTPPFQIDEEKQSEANEQLRLQYRFIDLRRPKLQEMLRIRDEVIRHMRDYFHKENFIEVQTPILANSSPEGARDWLGPPRQYPGEIYSLPHGAQQLNK